MKREQSKVSHMVKFYHLTIENILESSLEADCLKSWTISKNEQTCTLRITCQRDDKHDGRPVDLTIELPIDQVPDDYRVDADGTVEWNFDAVLLSSGLMEKFLSSTPETDPQMTYSPLDETSA